MHTKCILSTSEAVASLAKVLQRLLINPQPLLQESYQGKTQTRIEWAKELGIKKDTLDGLINRRGWSVEKAFSTRIYDY